MTSAEPVLFETTVVPHRSLSERGLRTLILALCGCSMLIATLFYLLGAWPVIGFSGVEIALAVVLLRLNARAKRRSERIVITPAVVRVMRTDEQGRERSRTLRSAWLNVILQERAGRVPALYLSSRPDLEEVARETGETEKRALADALASALHRARHPRFDNPQLRDGPQLRD